MGAVFVLDGPTGIPSRFVVLASVVSFFSAKQRR
jgi:hypothetical protein